MHPNLFTDIKYPQSNSIIYQNVETHFPLQFGVKIFIFTVEMPR